MGGRGDSRVATGDGDGRSAAGLGSAVSHGRRVEAELDAGLGTTDGATVGEAVGGVGSHGDGALARVIWAGAVEVRAAARDGGDSGGDGGLAVHRRR